MRPLLLILNPRRIEECIESFERLQVSKAWLVAFTEAQLVDVVARLVEETPWFTHYVMASDDLVVSQEALDAVVAALETHPVVTGYCNFDLTDDPRVGLSVSPLTAPLPGPGTYDFPTQAAVDAWPEDPVRTWFAGWVLTGMSRELWQRYPFQITELGAQSDYALSWRLQQDDVPIVAPKAARTFHVKELHGSGDKEPRKRLLIGEVPAEVRIEVVA